MQMTKKKNLSPVHDWRRQNLERLISEYGSIAEVARKTGMSDSYLSQVRNRTRGMGHIVAFSIEKELGLETGWMSRDQDQVRERPSTYGGEAETTADEKLKRVLSSWESLTERQKDEVVRNITGLERSNKELLKDLLDKDKAG
jgi:transcriptional regulator with XRE-family HTH domain